MSRSNPQHLESRILLSLARAYLGIALRTTRWTVAGHPDSLPSLLQTDERSSNGCIVACWHRALLLLPAMCAWGHRQNKDLVFQVMVSRNRSGRLINDLVAPWGIIGIEGSSDKSGKNKGGSRALRQACAAIKAGAVFAITPDGPRGPAENVQRGTPALMRLTGRPLIPIGAACTSISFPSWDRLRIPVPFGRGYLFYGAPCLGEMSSETIADQLRCVSFRAERSLASARATLFDRFWQMFGTLLIPGLRAMMLVRLRRGKERAERLPERRGRATIVRPRGTILWLHAASVGETHSILPLIEALEKKTPSRRYLITTATTGGADIVAHYLAEGGPLAKKLIHQFIPYDVPLWTRRFLDHWKPCALLLTDSELWPGLIFACTRRAIPIGVINGRLSLRSWRQWQRARRLVFPLFRRLNFVAARDQTDAARFLTLGAKDVVCLGDLKQKAPPPPVDKAELTRLQDKIGSRPVFLAASTHAGEEEIILRAVQRVQQRVPDLLTIIAPRHPIRALSIVALAAKPPPLRSILQDPGPFDTLWIADTLGEMGLFYRLADCAFIGNSLLAPGGGHNPFEAVALDVELASGPHRGNFRTAFEQLEHLIKTTSNEYELAEWIETVVLNPVTRQVKATCSASLNESPGHIPPTLIDRINKLCG